MKERHLVSSLAFGGVLSIIAATGCVGASHEDNREQLTGDLTTQDVPVGLHLGWDIALDRAFLFQHQDGGTQGGNAADAGSVTPAKDAGATGNADDSGAAATKEDSGAPPSEGDSGTATTTTTDAGSASQGGSQIGASFLASLGKSHLLVGASMEDNIATEAQFDARYMYLAGGLFDSPQVCSSCTSDCTSWGSSCAGGACGWWGCWQDTALAPGQFAKGFFGTAQTDNEIPVISYYELLQASGATEGSGEVGAANDVAFMTRYLNDWRFLLQQVGSSVVVLHIEPDFWGYAEQVNANPHAIPAAIASANPMDCGSQENSIAGMGRCMIAMTRKYAPNAKVGLHASSWGVGAAVLLNQSPSYDVAGAAQQLGQFLIAAGAQNGDFIAADATDRDAGYYTSVGQNTWWDTTNATLPNFHQAFAWSKALAEALNLGVVWWQLPVGNMSLPNVTTQWTDNRVEYFFSHTEEVAAAHGVGMLFGAGATGMTTPSTDNGNLVSKTQGYVSSGGQAL